MIDIVGYLEQKAELKGWQVVIANGSSANYELSLIDTTDQSFVFHIDMPTDSEELEGGMFTQRLNTTITVMLSRKFECETYSSVAETVKQKYASRLLELKTELRTFLSEVFDCASTIEATSIRYSYGLNINSLSTDAAIAELNFTIWE